MKKPDVSVVIPAYKAAWCVGDAVQSIREQTFGGEVEVIVVDDGSPDDTWDAIQAAARSWDRVRPVQIAHGGTPVAINAGLAEARGEYIGIVGADDKWLPTFLVRCLEYLREHPDLSIVYTPMIPVTRDGQVMKGHNKPCRAGQLTASLFDSIFIHDSSTLFHRRVYDTCGGLDASMRVGSGHEFWLRVSTKFEFGTIEEPLAVRTWSEKTLTRSNRSPGLVYKCGMLERFYFEGGGRELIPAGQAMRRLSRVHYTAGKMLMKEGDYGTARQYLGKALKYRSGNLKAWPLYAAAAVMTPLGRKTK